MFYIAGRTLASGRADGFASCSGSALGGLVHVLAGAVGVSALVMASATAFTVLKLAGDCRKIGGRNIVRCRAAWCVA